MVTQLMVFESRALRCQLKGAFFSVEVKHNDDVDRSNLSAVISHKN